MKYDIFTIGYTFLCFKANDQALHVEIGKEHHFIIPQLYVSNPTPLNVLQQTIFYHFLPVSHHY